MSNIDKGKEEFIQEDLNFEDAVEQLSIIVNTMENSDVDLDNIIENYQKGLSLLKFCQDKIKNAEFKLTEVSSEPSTRS